LQTNKHGQINDIFQSLVDDPRCHSTDTNATPSRASSVYIIKAEHNKQRDRAKLINMARRSVIFC